MAQFSVGSVEGVPFTACTSGPDVIILASNFSRVQQITASSQITSLDCSTDVGKISAAYDNKMVIFEPIPLVQPQQQSQSQQQQPQQQQQQLRSDSANHSNTNNNNTNTNIQGTPVTFSKLDYKWVQTATIESESPILVMSFNLEGNRLVAGGKTLQLWIVEGATKTSWQCVWRCKTASNISYLRFSPDGTLFCSASKSDRLVKIWYESVANAQHAQLSAQDKYNDQNNAQTTLSTPNCLSPPPAFDSAAPTFTIPSSNSQQQLTTSEQNNSQQQPHSQRNVFKSRFDFSFIYIAHPMPVTGLEWRRTSKYTPRGAVANVLITSCKDNIARIWVQTLLPDDGLVNFNQLKSQNGDGALVDSAPRVQTQRHRQKLLRRLKRMKAFSQFKKRQVLALDHSIDELEKVATTDATSIIINETNTSNNINSNANIHSNNNINVNNANNNNNQNNVIQANGVTSNSNSNTSNSSNSNATIPTALSSHDFHSYALCSTVIKPGLHFHLAAIIEASDLITDTQSLASQRTAELIRTDTTKSNAYNEENTSSQFVVHWINNKEIHITRSIELLLHDMLMRILRGNNPTSSSTNSPQSGGESCSGSENDTDELDETNDDTITAESSKKLRHKLCHKMNKQRALAASGRRDPYATEDYNRASLYPNNTQSGRASPSSLVEEFDKTLETLLRTWQMSSDLLFSVNKTDGTLTLWQAKYLDGEDTGVFRQVQIDKLSHLKAALPHYDATTMTLNVIAYSPSAYLDVKRAYLAVTSSSGIGSNNGSNFMIGDQFSPVDVPEILSINTDSAGHGGTNQQGTKQAGNTFKISKDNISANSIADAEPSIFIVTQHFSGILGLWKLNFDSTYPKVQSVDLVTRITGLPIDPSWLKDGTLVVEYDGQRDHLITKWVPDDLEKKSNQVQRSIKMPLQSSSSNPFSFDEMRTSLIYDMPEVEDESSIAQSGGEPEIHKDIYRASQLADGIKLLPQYHPKLLIELLAFGKLLRVKAILNHLVNCLILSEAHQDKDTDTDKPSPWAHRSRTLSIVGQSAPSFNDSFDIDNPSSTVQQQIIEEIELDYIEVTSIRPLPLYSLLQADTEKHSKGEGSKTNTVHDEFSPIDYESIIKARSQVDETLDEILGKSTIDTLNKQKELKRLASDGPEKGSLTNFNPRKARLLTRVLTHTHLPGLSNVDQMHLLAVADAIALFDASPEELNETLEDDDSQQTGMSISKNFAIDSLDDRGLRFLTAMRQHVYLTKCLPMKQRNELKAQGIGTHNIVWAFHSESQDELISLIPCVQRNKPDWPELREYGVGWWVKKLEDLRKLIERVAQSAYQARQDPLDAALFYLAMKKKTLVCALMRRVNCDKRLLKLFEQDFSDPINRKKALKNAYALLGLHRFEHAAAFFILAGSIWDAVEVCINNLGDIQLAIILIRLHDNDANMPNNLRKLLSTEILGFDLTKHEQQQQSKTNPAASEVPANSFDQQQQQQLKTQQHVCLNYDPKLAHPDPFLRSMALWKLGDYLSAVHTLLEIGAGSACKHQLQQQQRTSSVESRRGSSGSHFGVASAAGSSTTTFDSSNNKSSNSNDKTTTASTKSAMASNRINACVFNFYLFLKDQPLVQKHRLQSIEAAIAERERLLFFSAAHAYLDVGCALLALEVLSCDQLSTGRVQRMKFICCLHILMNELNTLSAAQQQQFHEWLQKSIEAQSQVCSYANCDDEPISSGWVQFYEPILRTMLTYSNFHSADENSLLSVRMELVRLLRLTEQQQQPQLQPCDATGY